MILATLGRLAAQDPSDTPSGPTPTTPPANPAVPADPQQLPDNSQSGNRQAPQLPQGTTNYQGPNTPLLPGQAGNAYSPYSINSQNPQSSQITAPSVYTTGGRDISQISTNAGLSQAFTPPAESGYLSEQRGGYSHAPIERLLIGPFDLKSTLLFNVVNDDNLRAGEVGQGKVNDTSFSLTPAVLLQYGTHEGQRGYASLVYAPTFTRFYHQSDEDSNNQNVAFGATYPFQRLTLDLSESFAEVTGYDTDLNSRTTQTSIVSSFGGSYDIDDKLSFASHVQNVKTSFSGTGSGGNSGMTGGQSQGEGDSSSSINSTLSYHLSDKMSLNASGNFGVDKPEDSKQQTFEQGTLGITYLPTEKISFFAQGGIEFRQGVTNGNGSNGQGSQNNGGGGDETNPIFSAGVGYTPFDSTVLQLSANQSVHNSSAQTGQSVVNTGVGVTVTQRFIQRFFLNLAFSYSHQENGSSDSGDNNNNNTLVNGTGGEQDALTYRASVSVNPTAWSTVAVYYQYLDNEGSSSGSSSDTYHDNQLGFSASVQF